MKHKIAIVFLSLTLATPASAQYELKSGLNYTSVSKPKKAKPAPPASESEAPKLHVSQDKKETADPATIVWEKYKALATGQAGESYAEQGEETNKAATKSPAPSKQVSSKNDPNNPNARKSLSFKTPDTPVKPTIAKPTKTTFNGQSPASSKASDPEVGIKGILSNWQKSKESQREMRSKSFSNSSGVSNRKAPAPTATQNMELNE